MGDEYYMAFMKELGGAEEEEEGMKDSMGKD
jgi:hypothetical protein